MNIEQSPTLNPPSGMGRGALRWGMKSSFVSYVESAPDGTRTATGVLELPGDAGPVFEFPLANATTGQDGTLVLGFTGSLQFQAHNGMLDVNISSPAVTFKDGWADVSVKDMSGGGTGHTVRIARFESGLPAAVNGRVFVGSSGVLLTTQGSQLLGDVYPARTLLEPITIDVSVPEARQ